jgi:hypothetical protein
MVGFSEFAFNSVAHVGVSLPNTSISPLSRGRGGRWWAFQNLSSPRYRTSAYLSQTPQSVPSPEGEGGDGGPFRI